MIKQFFSRALLGAVQLLGVAMLVACVAPPPARVVITPPVFPPPPDEPRFIYERTLYSNLDVISRDNSRSAFQQLLTGEGDTQYGEGLGKPYGVAVYHGRVFVSDSAIRAVAVFDIPGQRFFYIGQEEPGQLRAPLGLDVDGKGNVYVVDASTKIVQVYDNDGKYLRSLANGGKWFNRPSGIAVDAEGTRIYVVDTGGISTTEHRVRVFDAQSGAHLLDIGTRGTGPGELNLPRDVTIGNGGLLYVVDGANFRVQVFKPDGTFVRTFGSIGRQSGQFSRPKEAATDADGNVYVVDTAFGNFQIFNPEGQLLLSIGSRSETDGMAKYMLPSGIAVDGDGRVYMVDQYFRKVDVYRPAKLAAEDGFTLKKMANSAKP
jgi:DNA-binding beta-propeller fold protein YncE